MAADYSWHEEVYQHRKSEGAAGFDKTQENYAHFQQISAAQMASEYVPRSGRLTTLNSIVTPDTVLRLYRQLIARKYDGPVRRGPGRPRIWRSLTELVLQMARENP